jgi:hypothetical protein
VLLPRLHWLSKEDDKFHHLVKLDIPVAGNASIVLGPVDANMEPRREKFIPEMLSQRENDTYAPVLWRGVAED